MSRTRIGIDTGGTFTDVVAVDEDTGAIVATKTPSTPADPAVAFMAGVRKVLDLLGLEGDAVSAVCHGTTVATNQLLEGKVGELGFITNEGYEFLLEIARQSVPDGYGNSYFWVKPDRIVPVHRVRTVRGRLAFDGSQIRPFDEAQAVEVARWFREKGIDTIGVSFLHSYVDDSHERAMRDVLAREHPDAVVSISSEVLREYREFERAVTTLVDAAVKPGIRRYVADIAAHLATLRDSSAGSTPAPPAGSQTNRGAAAVARASVLDPAAVQKAYDELAGRAGAALAREGFAEHERVLLRTADLRYFGQACEVRVDVPDGAVTDELVDAVQDRFHDEHRALYGFDNRGDARQEVEWVNLRVTGVGPIRPGHVTAAAGERRRGCRHRHPAGALRRVDRDARPGPCAARRRRHAGGPCRARGVRLHPAAAPRLRRGRRRLRQPPGAQVRMSVRDVAGVVPGRPG